MGEDKREHWEQKLLLQAAKMHAKLLGFDLGYQPCDPDAKIMVGWTFRQPSLKEYIDEVWPW